MASAGTVTVDFSAETARFTAELQKVNSRLKGIEGSFKSLGRVAKAAMGAFSAGALVAFVKSAANAADELGKASDKIGITTSGLRAFEIASTEAGVSIESTSKLLLESQKRLGEAAAGTGEAAKFIKLLGLNVKELQQLAPDELFKTYATAINGLSNRGEQLAAAQALMGKASREAFNLIQAGSPAFDEAAQFVERFALALDRVSIKQIEQANDQMGRLGMISQGAGQQIAAGLAPFVEAFSLAVQDATGSTEGFKTAATIVGATVQTAFAIAENAARSLQAAFFTVAAGVAAAMRELVETAITAKTFLESPRAFFSPQVQAALKAGIENGTASLTASVEANLTKAKDALSQIQSIEQIQSGIIANLEASRARAEAAVAEQAARDAAAKAGGLTLGGEDAIGLTQQQNFDLINDAAAAAAEARKAIEADLTDFTIGELTRRSEASQNIRDFEMASEQAAMNFMAMVRQNAFTSILGGLQAFAGKSKKIAIALVAVNKGMAIAKAVQDGFVAVQAALAWVPWPANLAAAAQMKVMTALNVAGIAASGIGQIQSINSSGGAALGSQVNPVFTSPQGADQQFGATSQRTLQVIVQGNVIGNRQFIDDLIENIKDAVDDRDVVLISNTSRNAKELVGA